MNKSLKLSISLIFGVSVFFIFIEAAMIIQVNLEIGQGGAWTAVGYYLYSLYIFVLRAILLIASVACFFYIPDKKIKDKYFYFSLLSIVFFVLLILTSLAMNIWLKHIV